MHEQQSRTLIIESVLDKLALKVEAIEARRAGKKEGQAQLMVMITKGMTLMIETKLIVFR